MNFLKDNAILDFTAYCLYSEFETNVHAKLADQIPKRDDLLRQKAVIIIHR
jgi:hypothetical protein